MIILQSCKPYFQLQFCLVPLVEQKYTLLGINNTLARLWWNNKQYREGPEKALSDSYFTTKTKEKLSNYILLYIVKYDPNISWWFM